MENGVFNSDRALTFMIRDRRRQIPEAIRLAKTMRSDIEGQERIGNNNQPELRLHRGVVFPVDPQILKMMEGGIVAMINELRTEGLGRGADSLPKKALG